MQQGDDQSQNPPDLSNVPEKKPSREMRQLTGSIGNTVADSPLARHWKPLPDPELLNPED